MPKPEQNLYGQEMGNKGILTRARIVSAVAELMQRRPLRDLRVAEIGKTAAVSTATFYLYFESVADAGLAAVAEVEQATPEVMSAIESEWTSANALTKAKAFVNAYVSVWDAHHALLRVRNFMADEGDKRFHDLRRRTVEPIHLALQLKVVTMQAGLPGEEQLDPPSTASVLLALLERLGAVIRLPSAHRATRPRQIQTAAFIVASSVMGRSPYGDSPEAKPSSRSGTKVGSKSPRTRKQSGEGAGDEAVSY